MNTRMNLTADERRAASYVIFDLDNCLFDDGWRIPLIKWDATDIDERYEDYHRAMVGDRTGSLEAYRGCMSAGMVPIFLTARPLRFREQTVMLIDKLLGPIQYVLIMRNNNDHRRSVEVKSWMLDTLHDYDIELNQIKRAFDDRQDIIDMYISRGIKDSTRLWIHDICAMTPPSPKTNVRLEIDASYATAIWDRELAKIKAEEPPTVQTLLQMADTFRERNAVYKDNYKTVGHLLSALYGGTNHRAATEPRHFEVDHLLWLIIVKLARFAHSDSTHVDSMLDIGVYAAMIATILKENQE